MSEAPQARYKVARGEARSVSVVRNPWVGGRVSSPARGDRKDGHVNNEASTLFSVALTGLKRLVERDPGAAHFAGAPCFTPGYLILHLRRSRSRSLTLRAKASESNQQGINQPFACQCSQESVEPEPAASHECSTLIMKPLTLSLRQVQKSAPLMPTVTFHRRLRRAQKFF